MSQIKTKFLGDNQVTNTKLAQMAANTIKGNNTGSTANAIDLTVSQTQTLLSVPTASSPLAAGSGGTGLTSPGTSGNVLTSNGSAWVSSPPSGGGGGTLNYWAGYSVNSSLFSTSSSSLTNSLHNGGTTTLTQRFGSGITVSTASNDNAGIVFTPAASTSVYIITASFCWAPGATNNQQIVQLQDTNGVIIMQVGASGSSAGGRYPTTLTGIYAPGTTSSVEVDLYAATQTGYFTIEPPTGIGSITPTSNIEWTITQIQ